MIKPRTTASVTAPATDLLVFDQATIAQVVSCSCKATGIDNDSNDLHGADDANTTDLHEVLHELVAPGEIRELAFILFFTALIQFDAEWCV